MNCDTCRQSLLERAEFEPVPGDAEAHLAACSECRRWRAQLALVETSVPRLPIPPSGKKQQFQEAMLQGLEASDMAFPPAPPPATLPLRAGMSLRNWVMVAAGGAVAAGILIMIGLLLNNARTRLDDNRPEQDLVEKNPHPDKEKSKLPDTLAGRLLAKNFDLARALTAEARLESLASLALLLHDEGRSLAPVAGPKELNAIADLYGKVVEGGIVPRARDLPVDRRRALGPIRNRLAEAGKEAEKLARAAPPEQAEPWLRIAAVARAGQQQLNALITEATP